MKKRPSGAKRRETMTKQDRERVETWMARVWHLMHSDAMYHKGIRAEDGASCVDRREYMRRYYRENYAKGGTACSES